jgi:ABC-type branched-subunit amino acid transport system substrate-binding protein
MKSRWTKIAVSCLMILTIVAALSLSCGGGGGGEGVTIVIGNLSDMTGPASSALIPINYALQDLAKYYNDNNLIPGVTFKVVSWDSQYNPARDVPGWDWIKSKKAVVAYTALPTTVADLASYAERDQIPLWALSYAEGILDPPGWVFLANCPESNLLNPLLQWIPENDPNFPADRPAKIGTAGWDEPYAISARNAIKTYCQAHPDKWDYVNGYLIPQGGTDWTSVVAGLKNCDYVWPPSTGTGVPTFMRQLRDSGWDGTFIGTDAHEAYMNLIIDTMGWAGVDGTLADSPTRWWTEEAQSQIVTLARQLLQANHPDKFNEFVYAGIGYIGGFQQTYAFFDVLKATIDAVGAANFSGQAFYNTAISFSEQWPGYGEWNFTATKRYTWNYVGIYKWEASAQNVVRIVDPWLPNTVD